MTYHYILDDQGNAEPCEDLIEWATWWRNNEGQRHLAKHMVGDVLVSTVFLGLDSGFMQDEPLLWETMSFPDNEEDQVFQRYSSKVEAIRGHEEVVRQVEEQLGQLRRPA